MWQRKYMLIQRDNVSRGMKIIGFYWSRGWAEWKARKLSAQHARHFSGSLMPRFNWEVDRRCVGSKAR